MEFITTLLAKTIGQVWMSFVHNWPFLLISGVVAAVMKLVLDPEKVKNYLLKHNKAGVIGATILAVTTPFCSCGTTAVLLGMLASSMPWAPIIAFMVASPLSSPEGMIYSAGLFGWPFAIAFFVASIMLGLTGGLLGDFLEKHKWLVNQSRYAENEAKKITKTTAFAQAESCSCSSSKDGILPNSAKSSSPKEFKFISARSQAVEVSGCYCSDNAIKAPVTTFGCTSSVSSHPIENCGESKSSIMKIWKKLPKEIFVTGKQLLWMFFAFASIGYLLNNLIPSSWVVALFGKGNIYSVPLAATLGIPLYINSEASLPLVRALLDGGMGQGAAMAFLITGSGTSVGAVMGALSIAKWKVIAVVIGTLWVGAILMGYLFNLLVASGIA